MKAPLITMSAVTGKPTKDEIFTYLKGLKENGIDQAMIYPRSGCELDYLEDEWFEVVGFFVDGAKELDMLLWIYDDFNWPSGDAHGRVSKVAEYRLRAICIKGEKCGEIDCYSKNKGSLFGETYFPNLLDEKAMDYFIQCTHEQYYKRFGEYFGTLIKGFYTDEPGVGYCCTDESMPYYDGMAEDYKELCSSDFFEDLKKGEDSFFSTCLELIGKKYRKCFLQKLSDWCKGHGVALTGHLMEDTTPFGATKQCGDLPKAMSCFDVPGIDELRTRFNDLCIYNLLGGVQYGRRNKKGAMAELFALGPCDISYENMRSIIYLCGCFGINHYFLALSPIDMRGCMSITDYFTSFTADTPNFGGMKILAEDAKKASLLADKAFTADVYVRYPTKICAQHLHKELNLMRFFKLVNNLTYNQIQWKYIDDVDVITDTPVIEFSDELEYIVDSQKLSLEQVLNKFRKSPYVTDLDGNVNEGIFLRKYDDGTLVVLNLYAQSGMYLVCGKKVYLHEHDVKVFVGEIEEFKQQTSSSVDVIFDVKYLNDNMIRSMFVDEQTKALLTCEADTEVVFALRNGEKALLDGKTVNCPNENSALLCNGYKKLYKVSDKILLKKGEHTVESGNDKKYLPSVFMMGSFLCESKGGEICNTVIYERSEKYRAGDKLNCFGGVELCGLAEIPALAKQIELEGAQLYTRLFIDGTFVGEGIYSPFVFDIPESVRGKRVSIKLEQYSGLGQVFGDVEYFTENSKTTNWKTPSPVNASFGMEKIKFIL